MLEYGIAEKKNMVQILELYKQLKPNEKPISLSKANEIWREIKKNNIRYFVAKDKGVIVATCYICIIPNLTKKGKSIGFIENVVTDKEYKRKGIGKKIIENAIKHAKKNNCYKVFLQTGIKRREAHKFYKSLGFELDTKKTFEIIF